MKVRCLFCKKQMKPGTFCVDVTDAAVYFYNGDTFMLVEDRYGVLDSKRMEEFEKLPDDEVWESSLEDGEVYCPECK